jgi:hypothetical protein
MDPPSDHPRKGIPVPAQSFCLAALLPASQQQQSSKQQHNFSGTAAIAPTQLQSITNRCNMWSSSILSKRML